ncbi:MAG: efflux RND transporter permease subunit, partial [Deltaproteobacteria bacterium]|nr:efflux RND transporter permease subunit [Deltaproteobacteria bacterium]
MDTSITAARETFFVRRPVLSTVLSVVITMVGVLSLRALPVEQYPNLVPPQVQVYASYPGASAQVISETVAAPLEQQLSGVEDMIYMQSTSSGSGEMQLNVYFNVGTDPDQAAINVNNRVQIALNQLPEAVRRFGVTVLKKSPAILQIVTLSSPEGRYDALYLSNYAGIYIADELKRLQGVGDVQVFGSREYSMRVWLRPDRMADLKLSPADVSNAIKEQNAQYAAGRIGEDPLRNPVSITWQLNTQGRLVTPEQFGDIIVRSSDDGSVLRLRDVATIELGGKDYSFVSNANGKPAQMIGIFLAPGANALETAQRIRQTMDRLAGNFPVDVVYDIPYDTTVFVGESIKEVVHTLLEAMLLVFGVVFLFLQNWRATLIPCLAVPVSILGTFAGMYALGFSVNTLT